jgi:hypothetical protein
MHCWQDVWRAELGGYWNQQLTRREPGPRLLQCGLSGTTAPDHNGNVSFICGCL